MQNFRCVGAIAAMAAFVQMGAVGASFAQASATVAEQTGASVAWRCEGERCAGAATRKGNVNGLLRECRKVVKAIGPVASYKSGPRELSEAQVRACNRAATQFQTASN
jgi:hypothetical protein